MARAQNVKQINFIPADDIAEKLEKCENKTKIINEALRIFFSNEPYQIAISERLQRLEDFRLRFMAYYRRKDNEPHSEFCDCQICNSNRKSFGGSRLVELDPEPQTCEFVLSMIERAKKQAERMNATVFFESSNYKFQITVDTDIEEEYGKYMDFANP